MKRIINSLAPTCEIFTVLTIIFSALVKLTEENEEIPIMTTGSLLQILLFSFFLGIIWAFLKESKLGYPYKLLIHFSAFIADFIVVFLIIGKHYGTSKGAVILVVTVAVMYSVAAAIVSAVRYIVLSGKEKNTDYKRVYR